MDTVMLILGLLFLILFILNKGYELFRKHFPKKIKQGTYLVSYSHRDGQGVIPLQSDTEISNDEESVDKVQRRIRKVSNRRPVDLKIDDIRKHKR